MGDDFDLFPKRENLDPFSFGKKEKGSQKDGADEGEELFGQEKKQADTLPDLPVDLSQGTSETPAFLSDFSLDAPGDAGTPAAKPPLAENAVESEPPPDSLEGIISEEPIMEGKTFDEPVFEQEQEKRVKEKGRSRKSPSPFLIVSGALVIVIGVLYGALTYLKRDKPLNPGVTTPPVSVTVPKPKPGPVPVPKPKPAQPETRLETQTTAQPETKAETEAVVEPGNGAEAKPPEPPPVTGQTRETPGKGAAAEGKPAAEKTATVQPAPKINAGEGRYSVQVGALILKSSVAELEGKLRGLGYESFRKVGSTTAMMNMLTVGPFEKVDDARTALKRLRGAGVESNLRQRDNGSTVIDAGSYLLEENASNIMRKIRSLGYPVSLAKKEARLPMTFVRVGRYKGVEDASAAREELKSKGLEGIVVKIQ